MRFFTALFGKPRLTGAVAPSSRFLVRRMIAPVDFADARHIVELGPGTGNITRALMDAMSVTTKLTVIEANETFAQPLLAINDARLRVFNGLAQDLHRYDDGADTIISSVPLGSPGPTVAKEILAAIATLPGLKTYIQFTYTRRREHLLTRHFTIERSPVLLNIPPAHVYTCTPRAPATPPAAKTL